MNSRTERLRRLLAEPGLVVLPGCHDAISARIMERAGFPVAFMSGLAVSAARIGAPDTGLISFGEMLDQGRNICGAVSIPVIGDGDTGYGNAVNVKRTVAGYAGAGFAAVMIEDQSLPKRCGFARGVEVVDRAEAVARIRAAADARDEGADILVLGRTDAATTLGIEEGLWRAKAYQDAGCDIVYVEGAESAADLEQVARAIALPKMYVTVEGVPEQKVSADDAGRPRVQAHAVGGDPPQRVGAGHGGGVRGDARRPASRAHRLLAAPQPGRRTRRLLRRGGAVPDAGDAVSRSPHLTRRPGPDDRERCPRRPRPDLVVDVRVQPRASRDRIAGFRDGTLRVFVGAPPERGQGECASVLQAPRR